MSSPMPDIDWDGMRFVESLLGGFCYSHSTFEPYTKGSIPCGECFHVFYTERDLIDDFNKLVVAETLTRGHDAPFITTTENIFMCPHCLHDF